MNKRFWTSEEKEVLIKHYADLQMEDLLRLINRTESQIYNMAFKLKLQKSEAYLIEKRKKEGETLKRVGVKNRFKKGHNPANAGKTGVRVSPKSEFKKGHLPQNTLHDGAIRIRNDRNTKTGRVTPYKYIRIAKAKWVLYQRHLWEQHNGPIPKGHMIRFRDGDTMNCTIENLECISMAENARRNANRKKAIESFQANREEGYRTPSEILSDQYVAFTLSFGDKELRQEIKKRPDLIALKRTQLLLNRKIKNHEKQNE
jgi:hypothetical protein